MPFDQGKIQTAVGTGERGYAGDGLQPVSLGEERLLDSEA